jgi:hypothetical protein
VGRNPIAPVPPSARYGGGVLHSVGPRRSRVDGSPRRGARSLGSRAGRVLICRARWVVTIQRWVCPRMTVIPNLRLSPIVRSRLGLAPCPTPTPTSPIPSRSDRYFRRGRCRDLCSPLPQPVLQVRRLKVTERYRKDGHAQGEHDVLHRGGEVGDLLQAAIVAETHE